MLAIGIRGDQPGRSGECSEKVVDAGFERTAFAQINRVAQEVNARLGCQRFEHHLVFLGTAVVHKNDSAKAGIEQ